ncbi:hypothetical protein KBTX_01228 [wastewater metagenome]|uniref:MltA-interacting protein MipA n=2 Tax=unclassified sequences TaxID=12908 RepID=A0A5B8R889_9ZZZZ|nr:MULTISPECIES: MipA/OmpV family protein [Arhodomonas]MCS4504194.1 MipA/OmpV family protein [Arhodomonas aquaeolei]QEA04910.1 hypothetical protein KBTEX_01228 [uncultured organism]
MGNTVVGITAAIALTLAATAAAADGPETTVRLGAGVLHAPSYRGSDDHDTDPVPYFDIRHGPFYATVTDGIGWDVFRRTGLRVGPFVTRAGGRSDAGDLEGLESVDGGALAGIAAHWRRGPWRLRGDIATPVTGDLEGLRARVGTRYAGRIGQRWRYAVGPDLTWGDDDWNDALFAVSPAGSARSGLDAFHPGGAYYEVRVTARVTRRLGAGWSVTAITRAGRILGDAADSPIVADVGDANQTAAGIVLSYAF